MKNIVFADTNFLVNNIGNIKNINEELKDNEIDLYIPELVKDEFINIQLRKLTEAYSKLENMNNLEKIIDLKYIKKEKAENKIQEIYEMLFEHSFKNKIISYNKENMLERILDRNKYKKPPFYKENNSSDKGFKDTIILLTIKDFINENHEDTNFYFITSDNGFIKYKDDIENEFFYETAKSIVIIDGKDKEKIYKELNIKQVNNEVKEENIFAKKEINIDEIREKINNLMDSFITTTGFDYYGNPQEERRFEISNFINNEKTEKFLNNIDNIIEQNIFRNDILVEQFFDTEEWVFSKNTIEVTVVKEISDLYKKVKDTKYKDAFINYISQRINENKVNNMFSTETDDDELPF